MLLPEPEDRDDGKDAAKLVYQKGEMAPLCRFMDSETKIDRRYADLVMIIRPDKRYGKVFDVLIEFKFVKLKDAGMSAAAARKLSEDELCLFLKLQAG